MSSMTAWLDTVRQALDESDTRTDFFFRDDDVGWANDEFRALLACFRRHSVPLDIAVIPSALTAEFADEIRTAHDEAPALIGIHQHGFSHSNYEVIGGRDRTADLGVMNPTSTAAHNAFHRISNHFPREISRLSRT